MPIGLWPRGEQSLGDVAQSVFHASSLAKYMQHLIRGHSKVWCVQRRLHITILGLGRAISPRPTTISMLLVEHLAQIVNFDVFTGGWLHFGTTLVIPLVGMTQGSGLAPVICNLCLVFLENDSYVAFIALQLARAWQKSVTTWRRLVEIHGWKGYSVSVAAWWTSWLDFGDCCG